MRAGTIALGLAIAGVPAVVRAGVDEIDLLVYTRTTGFRHDSIPDGIAAVQQIAAENGWVVVATEDPAMFEPATLSDFEVIVFLSTTGDVLDDAQQAALQAWVQAGGGFVGIHSASNTEEDWPWFVGLLGTTFADHPAQQTATVHVADASHPSTMHLVDPWVRFDEWYNFDSNPSDTVDVLLRLDETTYEGGTMGRDHPIAWAHEYDGGRSFYTGLGHTIESWSEPEFLAHVEGAIEWAADAAPVGGESSSESAGSDSGGESTSSSASTGVGDDTGTPMPGSSGALEDASASASEGADSSTGEASETADHSGCSCTARAGQRGKGFALAVLLLIRRRRGTRAADRRRT
jgi:type 1 glutamine amidotransferase